MDKNEKNIKIPDESRLQATEFEILLKKFEVEPLDFFDLEKQWSEMDPIAKTIVYEEAELSL